MERRLAAILAADIAGYSRLMAADEPGTLARFKELRDKVIEPTIVQFGGRIVGSAGDSFLVEFTSAVSAVECAVQMQAGLTEQNANFSESAQMAFRVGLNVGDVMVEGSTIYGDGVNIAARLEKLSEPGGICVGRSIYEQVNGKVQYTFADLGTHRVHNIPQPIQAYRVQASILRPVSKPTLPLPEKPSIAVLPFENMSGDAEQEYFADGIVEEIITALSKFRQLFVIARNSSFTYKGRTVDVKQVGRDLGVRYLLEGSVRKAGGKLRIIGQLIDATTGAHLWADRFEGSLENVFELQDQLTAKVVGAIEPNIRSAEISRARVKPPNDFTSYDRYLQALPCLYEHSVESLTRAETLLRDAVERDSSYADAIAALANCVFRLSLAGAKEFSEGMRAALALSRQAVSLDSNSAEVLATGASCEAACSGSFAWSADLAEAAIRAKPNSMYVLMQCAGAFAYAGESERAIDVYQRAWRINPIDPLGFLIIRGIGIAHFFARRFEDAASWENRVLQQHSYDVVARRYLAASLAHLGRLTEAREMVAEILRLQPNSSLTRSRRSSFKYGWMSELYVSGLQMAGLPE